MVPSKSAPTLLLLVCITASVVGVVKAKKAPSSSSSSKCPDVPVSECCQQIWTSDCPQNHCLTHILNKCPQRKALLFPHQSLNGGSGDVGNGASSSSSFLSSKDLRRAPQKGTEEPKCGTAEMNYVACTSKSVANKLFASCCEHFVPPECLFMCNYETDQMKAKDMVGRDMLAYTVTCLLIHSIQMLAMVKSPKCSLKYLAPILYCASQNRDNRQCCADLDLNAPQLMVGSRCLRFCDPSGTAIGRITKEDVTCLFNLNVIYYCAHSGIREM